MCQAYTQPGSCGPCHNPAPQKLITLPIASLRKNQNSKCKVQFLLNGHHFCTIRKPKYPKSNHRKLGTIYYLLRVTITSALGVIAATVSSSWKCCLRVRHCACLPNSTGNDVTPAARNQPCGSSYATDTDTCYYKSRHFFSPERWWYNMDHRSVGTQISTH